MSFHFMPFYTGDYLRDTQHLSPAEHGIYLKLLIFCWDQRGPAPLDERRLCGIVNARSPDEVAALRSVLAEFFTEASDGFRNRRSTREVERASAISTQRSIAGAKGRAKQLNGERYQAIAQQVPSKSRARAATPTTTVTTTVTSTRKSNPLSDSSSTNADVAPPKADKRNGSIHTAAVEVLQFLNDQTGRSFRTTETTLKPIKARLAEGYSVVDLKAVVIRRKAAWEGDDKMRPYLRPDTLFNATKFAQYVGEVPPDKPKEKT